MFFIPFKINLRQLKAYWIALIIFLSGILISFTVFQSYEEQAKQQAQAEFDRLADIRIFFIQNLCMKPLEQLNYIKQFFDASPYVSRQDFHTFVQYSLKVSSDLLGVGWYSINGADSAEKSDKVLLNFISTNINLKPIQYHFFSLDYLELANSHYPFYIESQEFAEFEDLFHQVENSPLLTLSGTIDFYQKDRKKGFLYHLSKLRFDL